MNGTAVIFPAKDKVEVQSLPVPEPKPNEVLVQTSCTLISTGTECIVLGQKFEPGTHWAAWGVFPFHPGYSNVGRVVKIGTEVKGLKEGDRVFSRTHHKQYVVVKEEMAVKVPEGVSDEEATFTSIGKIVQHGMRRAQIQLGDTVVIIGAGLLGQFATQYARMGGAGDVIVIDPVAKRMDMARAHGATHTLAMTVDQALEKIKEITQGWMADVVLDITGFPGVFTSALKLPRRFGKVGLIGDTGTPSQQHLSAEVITRDLTIFGAHDTSAPWAANEFSPWSHRRMYELFLKYVARKQITVANLVTHRYPVAKAPEAFDMLQHRREDAMGVVLTF